jgi:uncharacterized protein YndB with AHSA1/START domain
MTTATRPVKPNAATKPHVVSRVFDAPRELVWKVSTDPEHMSKWFAPEGMNGFYKTMDFRVGGTYHYGQRSDDGKMTMWGKVTYVEITPMDRIVYLQSFSDENGGIGTHPMAPTWPKVMYSVNTFEDLGNGRTRLTVNWTPAEGSTPEELAMFENARAGMDQGWKGTLDKLEAYLKTVQQ